MSSKTETRRLEQSRIPPEIWTAITVYGQSQFEAGAWDDCDEDFVAFDEMLKRSHAAYNRLMDLLEAHFASQPK